MGNKCLVILIYDVVISLEGCQNAIEMINLVIERLGKVYDALQLLCPDFEGICLVDVLLQGM